MCETESRNTFLKQSYAIFERLIIIFLETESTGQYYSDVIFFLNLYSLRAHAVAGK